MDHFYLRISEFAFEHPEWFTPWLLKSSLDLSTQEIVILDEYFNIAYEIAFNVSLNSADTIFSTLFRQQRFSDNYINRSIFTLKPDIFFSYIWYLEFQDSVKSSNQSMHISRKAVKIAWITLVVSIIFSIASIYFSQSTEIDETQFSEIKNLISSEVNNKY